MDKSAPADTEKLRDGRMVEGPGRRLGRRQRRSGSCPHSKLHERDLRAVRVPPTFENHRRRENKGPAAGKAPGVTRIASAMLPPRKLAVTQLPCHLLMIS